MAPECGPGEPEGDGTLGQHADALTTAERMARYGKIRDACTASGILGRGFLLAGIAMDETHLGGTVIIQSDDEGGDEGGCAVTAPASDRRSGGGLVVVGLAVAALRRRWRA